MPGTGERGPAGRFLTRGALTDAVPLTAGHRYRLAIEDLGDVFLSLG